MNWHSRAKATTSRRVALEAHVSQTTVSRVMRGSSEVRPATRRRVLEAIAELGFTPNQAARAMRGGATGSIGVVVASLKNVFYPELLEELALACTARGLRMMVWVGSGAGEAAAISAVRSRSIDGVLLTTASQDTRVLHEAVREGVAVVLVNRTIADANVDQVAVDNRGGGRLIAAYLSDHGRTRVGLIGGPAVASTAVEREAGLRETMCIPKRWYRSVPFGYAAGRQAAYQLLASSKAPDTLVCVADMLAFGAIDAARELRLHVPTDLWIVGFNDVEMASWGAFDLTTVSQPLNQLVPAGLELLLSRIRQPNAPPARLLLQPELRIRNTTAHAPAGTATARVIDSQSKYTESVGRDAYDAEGVVSDHHTQRGKK